MRSVPEERLTGLAAEFRLVRFDDGHVFFRPDEPVEAVTFPLRGVISLAQSDGVRNDIEILMIGSEGVIGLPLFLGTDQAPWTATARTAGEGYALTARGFRKLLKDTPSLNAALLRYLQVVIFALGQVSVCRGSHLVEKQCARWLLAMQDRVQADTFMLTQEFLARTLGVRTASVSVSLSRLQREGIIQYRRGRLTIKERGRLEQVSCTCYAAIRAEFQRLSEEALAPPISGFPARTGNPK